MGFVLGLDDTEEPHIALPAWRENEDSSTWMSVRLYSEDN